MTTRVDDMTDEPDAETLRQELAGLFKYIVRVRQEIAAIHRPAEKEHGFDSMGDQLDAIVTATEEATNTIMRAMERNGELLNELRPTLKDPAQQALLDKIDTNNNSVFEACSFQDITGQRVSKVVKSITYVEARVNALISLWGKEQVEQTKVILEAEKTEDEKLLHGPQLAGKGLSQDEIDALFD